MFGNQRPVAPWSNHHWWGQYDSPAELPNVAGARLQLDSGEVQAGDMAWSLSDGQLYVCIVGTAGAAIWNSIFSLIPSSSTTNLYVAADAATANDSGPGTIAEPLATLDEALRRTNRMRIVTAPVIIHMAEAAAGYTWSETLGPLQLFQPVAIVGDGAGQGGDGFTVLSGPKNAAAGTGQRVVVDPDGGLTVDALQGKTIEILSGSAAGDRRMIRNNTATNIVPTLAFTAAVAPGDTYRVVEPSVTINWSTGDANVASPIHIQGCGSPANFDVYAGGTSRMAQNVSSVLLANMRLQDDGVHAASPWRIASSAVFHAGVEITEQLNSQAWSDEYSMLFSGLETSLVTFNNQFRLPAILGLAPSTTAWSGWGTFVSSGATFQFKRLSGHLVYIADVSTYAVWSDSKWRIDGGAFRCETSIDYRGFLRFQSNTVASLNSQDAALPILVTGTGANAEASLVRVLAGGELFLKNVDAQLSGAGIGLTSGGRGDFLSASGGAGGCIYIFNGLSIDAPAYGAVVTQAGQIFYATAPTVASAPTEAAVMQGGLTTAPVANSTFAGLAAGAAIVNPAQADGSMVMHVEGS